MDPFTFEIIRHKLFSVIEEAVIALENVSGSPVAAEGHDLMVALYGAEGELLMAGLGYLHHLTAAARAVQHLIKSYSEEPGIFQDDVYFFNDPYTAALHAPDVYLISPIHWQGKLTGFVANFVHVSDIGGIDPGGFCPSARECYQEGFASRGIKIVERGKLRRDVMDTILNLVRDSGMVALDLKSQMAANHTAKERMQGIYRSYGTETVETVGKELIAQSEALLRQRLKELPDGEWRAREYYDLPDKICRIELTAKKMVDSLTYDFTGTSEQSPYGINCCNWATWGALFAPIFPLLAYDMTWNEGLTRPVTMIAPEGTLVNCRRPAPVSIATLGVVQVVNNLSLIVISKMLGASQKYKDRATAIWIGARSTAKLFGLNQEGEYIGHAAAEALAGSGGARAFRDGVDVGGEIPNVVSRLANVETQELRFPQLYLYRRCVPDSGGPGKYRGGVSHEYAITPHGGASDSCKASLYPGKGIRCPHGSGIFGGYPGCHTGSVVLRDGNISEFPDGLPATSAAKQENIGWGIVELNRNDILYLRMTGGGGYGDPLERNPELVLRDVLSGLVSVQVASDVYGVIVDAGSETVNLAATNRRKQALRRRRLGGKHIAIEMATRAQVPRTASRINEYLQIAGSGKRAFVQCTWCGLKICAAGANWKEHAITWKSLPEVAGPLRDSQGLFLLMKFFCPQCGTLLDIDVVSENDGPLLDRVHIQGGEL
ncbi:MAG: hydantoinase B/oxoprolinase family protein [Chloroflexi bacterium]|nr:hydantoinase B/oxoprolinase family protein [Chloroflexota bacterium]